MCLPSDLRGVLLLGLGAATLLLVPAAGRGGVQAGAPRDAPFQERNAAARPASADSVDVLNDARSAQARFERFRVRRSPFSNWSGAGRCDEHVGRFCIRFGSDDPDDDRPSWTPPPEPPEVEAARDELLATLRSAHEQLPGDRWIMGQWVTYLAEADRWEEALSAIEGCRVTGWWCAGLEGFVLHGQGRYVEAGARFERVLGALREEKRRRWTDPALLVDWEMHRDLERLEGPERAFLQDRIWTLSDPLYLVTGHALRTEHLARWVLSETRQDARNGHGMAWGDDLTELLVRYGPVVAYERLREPLGHLGPSPVLGRHRDQARHLIPGPEAVWDPASSRPEDWTTHRRSARSRHAIPTVPRIRSMDVQVSRFRRGDDLLLVTSWEIPVGREGRGAAGAPALDAGVFLLDERDLEPVSVPTRVLAEGRGAALGRISSKRVLLSVEVLDSAGEEAWRQRRGVALDPAPARGPYVSDLLVLQRPQGAHEEATRRVRSDSPPGLDSLVSRDHTAVHFLPGPVEVIWEIYGLRRADERLVLELEVVQVDRGFLRRAGEALGLLSTPSPVSVRWEETVELEGTPGAPLLRRVTLDLSELDAGTFDLSLQVSTPGTGGATATRRVTLSEGS